MQGQLHRRLRGEGSIYRKPRSPFLWIKYYIAGKPFRESTRTADPAKAARLLRQRLAQAERGEFAGPQREKITIDGEHSISGRSCWLRPHPSLRRQ